MKTTKKGAANLKGRKQPTPEIGGKIDLTSIADEEWKTEEDLPTPNCPAGWTLRNQALSPLYFERVGVEKGSEEFMEVEDAYRKSIAKGHELVRFSEKYNPNYEASYMKMDIKLAPQAFKIEKRKGSKI
jgi:hypothetical protein